MCLYMYACLYIRTFQVQQRRVAVGYVAVIDVRQTADARVAGEHLARGRARRGHARIRFQPHVLLRKSTHTHTHTHTHTSRL